MTSSKAPFSKRRRKGWCEFSSRIPYLHPVLRIRFSYFYNFHSSSGVSLKQQLPCAVLICKSQHLNHGHVQPAFKFQLARLYFLLFLKDNDKSNDAFKINLVTFSRQSSLSRNLLEQSSASLLKLLDLGGQLPRYLGNPTWRERRRVPLRLQFTRKLHNCLVKIRIQGHLRRSARLYSCDFHLVLVLQSRLASRATS